MATPLLHHERITAEGASPERWMLLLHGIYGAGRNWGTVLKRLVRERPDWGAVAVDLRGHGHSPALPPPHTIEACARDLARLVKEEEIDARAVLGHSFGGKVALVYASIAHDPPDQVWVVDSTPDARPPSGSAWKMLDVLRKAPGPFGDREEVIEAVMQIGGFPRPVAMWMSTNLTHRDGTLHWRLDPEAMEALLRSFFETDAWATVEHPRAGLDIHFVKATESNVIDADVALRLGRAHRASGPVHLHEVEGGHWLNADNPDRVVALLSEHL